MPQKIATNIAVREQIKLLNKQKKINTIFLIVLLICFLFGTAISRLVSGLSLIIFFKIYMDYNKEIKRLEKKYGK